MRKCRNWQTSKTKDLVLIASVWVQVPSSALNKKTQVLPESFLFNTEESLEAHGFKVSSAREAPSSVGSAGKRSTGSFSVSTSPHLPHKIQRKNQKSPCLQGLLGAGSAFFGLFGLEKVHLIFTQFLHISLTEFYIAK